VACIPQAWAAGSVFMMLQACLGITVDGGAGTVTIIDPRLPIGIDRLWVDQLRVGESVIDLAFERQGGKITVSTGAPPGMVRLQDPGA
jgi:glycogen debranching enzyme